MTDSKKLSFLFIFLSLLFSFSAISTVHHGADQQLYAGLPRFTKLPASIIHSHIFRRAHLPNVAVLSYESEDLTHHLAFSQYQIRPIYRLGKLSEYQTREVTFKNGGLKMRGRAPTLYGNGVGYGGIFMFAYRKSGQLNRGHDYYIKYEMTSISHVRGKLFPLAVGNRLSFHYTDLMTKSRRSERAQFVDAGKMVYQVIARYRRYQGSRNPVPGPIYAIKVSKTTEKNSGLVPQYVYYFSPKLGWYIQADYYSKGKHMATYRLVNWKR